MTPQEERIRRLRTTGLGMQYRGEVLAWLGGEPNCADLGRRNTDGDFVYDGLSLENVQHLGRSTHQWLGRGGMADLVVSSVNTARGWAILTSQVEHPTVFLCIPSNPTEVTLDAALLHLPRAVTQRGRRGLWTRSDGHPMDAHYILSEAARLPSQQGRVAWGEWTPAGTGWAFTSEDRAQERLLEALQLPLNHPLLGEMP